MFDEILKVANFYEKNCLAATHFSTDELDNITSVSQKQIYCARHLPFIGSGGDRKVFRLSSKKALKLDMDGHRPKQNENEALILQYVKSNIVPKLYRYASDFRWIEVELVRMLHNWSEFEAMSGIQVDDFLYILKCWHYSYLKTDDIYLKYKDNQFLKELGHLFDTIDLDVNEYRTRSNFGKTADGRLVILDLGFFVGYD